MCKNRLFAAVDILTNSDKKFYFRKVSGVRTKKSHSKIQKAGVIK